MEVPDQYVRRVGCWLTGWLSAGRKVRVPLAVARLRCRLPDTPPTHPTPTKTPLQNPAPNAYTLAIAGRKPFIVVHTALLELLTPAELQVGSVVALEGGYASGVLDLSQGASNQS